MEARPFAFPHDTALVQATVISHLEVYSSFLIGLWSLEAISSHLGNYFCTVAGEIFLNCKSDYVTQLLMTLQKPPIARVKSLGMIQQAFHGLSLFIVCSPGFPTSISTFFQDLCAGEI